MYLRVTSVVLNQWALDFRRNTTRILQAIKQAAAEESCYCLFPELTVTSYGCQDHFLEADTELHSWECLAKILEASYELNLVIDVGMPVSRKGKLYNCRIILHRGDILLIRPKTVLANDGLHRESRWFTPWKANDLLWYPLPDFILPVTRTTNTSVPFGDALVRCLPENIVFGFETCEELWSCSPPHIQMYANGAHIVFNASASHHELRKLSKRIQLVTLASSHAGGGAYVYANLRGCDAERIGYDGGAMVAVEGQLKAALPQFSFQEIELLTYPINISAINASRLANKTFGMHSPADYHFVDLHCAMNCNPSIILPSTSIPKELSPAEEIAFGPALWLWDHLRRSRLGGFFLCLSGGIDSASSAIIVFQMCKQLVQTVKEGNKQALQQLRLCTGLENYSPTDPRELCSKVLTTCYMPTENSSNSTEKFANAIAKGIGSHHLKISIGDIYKGFVASAVAGLELPKAPKFAACGGSQGESLALQNIQARCRMVMGYLIAQLMPLKQGERARGRLVLGSSNLPETLRGYLTKYDCSSSDLNPIGCISKADLRLFLRHVCETELGCGTEFNRALNAMLDAPPTAELEPSSEGVARPQTDEEDMGFTYAELTLFGQLRKQQHCGPFRMLQLLLEQSQTADFPFKDTEPKILCDKVKRFFTCYARNRHKTTVLPPSYHIESYSADDNRFDERPFLYPVDFTHQFERMDHLVNAFKSNH